MYTLIVLLACIATALLIVNGVLILAIMNLQEECNNLRVAYAKSFVASIKAACTQEALDDIAGAAQRGSN